MKVLLSGLITALVLLSAAPVAFAHAPSPPPSVPFYGLASGSFSMSPTTVSVTGAGLFQHLGLTSISATGTVASLTSCSGFSAVEQNVYTAANGDTINFAITNVFCSSSSPTAFQVTGTFYVVGGTGRFAHATGSGTISGTAVLETPDSGTFTFFQSGTIAY
jgi:hypothetical protein